MRIKIFNSYHGEDNFIINWQVPDYFLNWFVKNFSDGKLNYEKQKLDISKIAFEQFLEFFYSKPDRFSIAEFFRISSDIVTIWDVEHLYRRVAEDIDRLIGRKMIHMIRDRTTNKEIRTSKLKFQICENITEESEPIIMESTLNGQIVYIKKHSIDHGYGEKERYLHEAEYFLDLSIRIFGVPLANDTIEIDIRPEFLEKYNCQRVTKTKLENFIDKNRGKKIDVPLRYRQSADGWEWDFTITDKNKIIEQLEF